MEILDAHQHLGVIADFVKGDAREASSEGAEQVEHRTRVESMDRSEIDRAIIGPSYGYLMPGGVADTRKLNDSLAAFRDSDPQRFPFAVGAIEPRQGEAALEEVRRIRSELGMVGVMWHNRLQGCYVDSPWMRRCVREAVDVGLVPFVHSHHGSLLESPWRVERLAQEFPQTTFVVIDGLAGFEETELFYDIVARRDNLVFDTGMWSGGSGKVKAAAREMGIGRLVFGSGLYSHPMGFRRTQTVEAVQESRLTDEEQARLFALNLYEILGQKPLGPLPG